MTFIAFFAKTTNEYDQERSQTIILLQNEETLEHIQKGQR